MPPRRQVSFRQMEILVDFAETHRQIALGRFWGGPQGSQASRKAWESVAVALNAVAEGSTKTPEQWRRYWIEFKAKTKGKGADSRRSATATGGGPSKRVELTNFEVRVLALIGQVAVAGVPGVRIPIEIPEMAESQAGTSQNNEPMVMETIDSIALPEDVFEVEWLEDDQEPTPPQRTVGDEGLLMENPPLALEPSSQPEVEPSQNRQHHIPSRRPRQARRRDDNVPQWAYALEERRIATEERIANALEILVGVIRQLSEDVRRHFN